MADALADVAAHVAADVAADAAADVAADVAAEAVAGVVADVAAEASTSDSALPSACARGCVISSGWSLSSSGTTVGTRRSPFGGMRTAAAVATRGATGATGADWRPIAAGGVEGGFIPPRPITVRRDAGRARMPFAVAGEPAGVLPIGVEPIGVESIGVEPAGVEPAVTGAVEPALADRAAPAGCAGLRDAAPLPLEDAFRAVGVGGGAEGVGGFDAMAPFGGNAITSVGAGLGRGDSTSSQEASIGSLSSDVAILLAYRTTCRAAW